MFVVTVLFLLWVFAVLPGCGGTPYLTVGAGYQLDDQTDYWLKTEQDWTCDKQPTAHAELGLEFDNKLTVGYLHQSWWLCGGPFNSDPEVYRDQIIVKKTWGGK